MSTRARRGSGELTSDRDEILWSKPETPTRLVPRRASRLLNGWAVWVDGLTTVDTNREGAECHRCLSTERGMRTSKPDQLVSSLHRASVVFSCAEIAVII